MIHKKMRALITRGNLSITKLQRTILELPSQGEAPLLWCTKTRMLAPSGHTPEDGLYVSPLPPVLAYKKQEVPNSTRIGTLPKENEELH